ncbi:uncharacterized protein LOC111630991 [Centruroides sculpturatus]|uniref:uncharacterized protein LOC111630991 n=1 Tax=Centruroides sculpturatus TaxID=218467 RepID=UPI000C6CAAB8|nr:uncharacterized protein LOC111630991 [Centruroides sculpturatus]
MTKRNLLWLFFLLLIAKITESNHRKGQAYSIKYKVDNEMIPIRIEFDDIRQVEYVMNLHSDKGGRNSVTFYDFKQGVVIYKELTARECYIARLTYETLERERAKLERKKNFIIDSSSLITVYANNKAILPSKMKNFVGIRGARFCRGMQTYLIEDKYNQHLRSKRQAGHYVQRSYGHYGQHNTNYAHYGHETYTIGSYGIKDASVDEKNEADGKIASQFPVFILLPLSQQSNIHIKHNGGYHLQLPIGQIKSTYNGNINEGQINKEINDKQTKDGMHSFIQNHKWLPIQIDQNSTNETNSFTGMIIIPGLNQNILLPKNNQLWNHKKSETTNKKGVNIDVHLKTNSNNSTAYGNAQIGGHRSFVSGNNLGKGAFTALSRLDSSDVNLYNKVQGNVEETAADASALIPGEGNAKSMAKASILTGNTSAESSLSFPTGDSIARVQGNHKLSKAQSQARSNFSSSGTHTNITRIKSKTHSLKGEVNATARYINQKGKSEASLRNEFSGTSSYAKTFGRFQNQPLNSAPYSPVTETKYVIHPINSQKRMSSLFSNVPSRSSSDILSHSSQFLDLKLRKIPTETKTYEIPYDVQNSSKRSINFKQTTHLFPDIKYPNITVENILYPQYLLIPSRSRNTAESILHTTVYRPSLSKTRHNTSSASNHHHHQHHHQNRSEIYPILIRNRNLFLQRNQTSNNQIRHLYNARNHRLKIIKNTRKNKIRPNIYTEENRKQVNDMKSKNNFRTDVYNKTKERDKTHRKHVNPLLLIRMQCCRYPLQRSRLHCCSRKPNVNFNQYHQRSSARSKSKCLTNKTCHFLYRTTQRIQICKVEDAKMC